MVAEVDADHQTTTAHGLDDRRGRRWTAHAAPASRWAPTVRGVGRQLALDEVERGAARPRRRPGCRRTSSRGRRAAQSMTSARATMPASGRPLARPLPMHMMSGRRSPSVLARPTSCRCGRCPTAPRRRRAGCRARRRARAGRPASRRAGRCSRPRPGSARRRSAATSSGRSGAVNSTCSMYAAPVRASAS